MNKTLLNTAIVTVLGASSFAASATSALVDGVSNLSITDGGTAVVSCVLGTAPPCTNTLFNQTGIVGSFFNLGGDTLLQGAAGINIGQIQTVAPGESHGGVPTGAEATQITKGWLFNGNTGLDGTIGTAVTAASATELNFQGWTVSWNGIDVIPMGGDAGQGDSGLATITCSTAGVCADGDSYTLDYNAHVPIGDPSGFGGALYVLHLEGVVTTASAVPVPAAAWLFGSGLLGLVGVARRKAKA